MGTSLKQAHDFLKAFKGAVNDGASLLYFKTAKNWDVLTGLGMTLYQRTEIILLLQPTDYIAGPLKDDKGRKGMWWVFGVKYNSNDIYIKIRLTRDRKGPKPVCISFHIADYPLSYPLKGD